MELSIGHILHLTCKPDRVVEKRSCLNWQDIKNKKMPFESVFVINIIFLKFYFLMYYICQEEQTLGYEFMNLELITGNY